MSMHSIVLDEHDHLDVVLRRLRVVCGWNTDLLLSNEVREKLAKDLQLLTLLLLKHFETEESGAYFEEIRSRSESAAGKLKALQSQHPLFLDLIKAIEQRCGEVRDKSTGYDDVQTMLGSMLNLLKRHEQQENSLLQEVFR